MDNLLLVEDTVTITCLIQPNGKISIYYENIPPEIEESRWLTRIGRHFECEPAYCQKYNTTETCRNASSKNITCFWCEKANRCIESNGQDTHDLKVINCRVEKILDVINPSTTPPKHIETTLEITDVQVRENLNDTVEETQRYSVSI
ncbi:unnamed protein product [Schistosoma mattheei]|uniref:Uncharacterized protein n=1 Tax=Schistosoma mattheei TaxID=31246 RepID=A0A183P3I1_9TREM|nr:unnamed protein product [Schistosoma mattheei]